MHERCQKDEIYPVQSTIGFGMKPPIRLLDTNSNAFYPIPMVRCNLYSNEIYPILMNHWNWNEASYKETIPLNTIRFQWSIGIQILMKSLDFNKLLELE